MTDPTRLAADPLHPMGPSRRRWLAGVSACCAAPALWAQDGPKALERIRARGRLSVGLYNDMPPFHVAGAGIDVEIARALAKALGVELSPLPFNADENMNDDLRNLVWRGHYLGFGPADVLLHVPVDRPLMASQPRVEIFAPYYRERVMIARDLQRVPTMDSLKAFGSHKIAVPGQSLAGWLLIGADGGAYREQLVTRWKDGTEAAQSLLRGEVAGAAGHASELQTVLRDDPRFAIEPLPVPRMREGWAVGMAVKKEATDLAQALQAAVNGLAASGELDRIFARHHVTWTRP
jgi:ABC-type amino acid transport substrate-binding protein